MFRGLEQGLILGARRVILEKSSKAKVEGWRDSIITSLDSDTPLTILAKLAMCGVDDPENCSCGGEDYDEYNGEFDSLKYLHRHHRGFNRTIWEAIRSRPTLTKRLRAACRRELRKNHYPDQSGGPWGKIINHEYARELLNNFLCAKPTWC